MANRRQWYSNHQHGLILWYFTPNCADPVFRSWRHYTDDVITTVTSHRLRWEMWDGLQRRRFPFVRLSWKKFNILLQPLFPPSLRAIESVSGGQLGCCGSILRTIPIPGNPTLQKSSIMSVWSKSAYVWYDSWIIVTSLCPIELRSRDFIFDSEISYINVTRKKNEAVRRRLRFAAKNTLYSRSWVRVTCPNGSYISSQSECRISRIFFWEAVHCSPDLTGAQWSEYHAWFEGMDHYH